MLLGVGFSFIHCPWNFSHWFAGKHWWLSTCKPHHLSQHVHLSKRDPHPCRQVPPPRGHQHPALALQQPQEHPVPRLSLEAEWQHHGAQSFCWPWPLPGAAALKKFLSLHQPHSSQGIKHGEPRGALGTELFPCYHRCWTLISNGWGNLPGYSNVCVLMTVAMV